MHVRKLVKAGLASHTISLPKKWLEKNGLSRGSTVYIVEEQDNTLKIKTNVKETELPRKEIEIPVDKKDKGTIQREITSAYLNNYNTVVLSGKELNSKAKDIRKILHDFVALEIAEQTPGRIVAKDMLNLSEVSVDKTIRRMDMILRSMLVDATSDDKTVRETLEHRDSDMNRLYFLLFRILKRALIYDRVASNFDLNRGQVLGRWYLILNLENLADVGKQIHGLTSQLSKKDFNEFKKVFTPINKNYLDVIKAYFKADKMLADSVAKCRQKTEQQFTDWLNANRDPVRVEIVEKMKTMSTLITNIARIVMDEE